MITSIAVSIEKSNIIGRPPVMRFRSLRHGATNGSGSLEVSGGFDYVDVEVTLRIMD